MPGAEGAAAAAFFHRSRGSALTHRAILLTNRDYTTQIGVNFCLH